MSFRKVSIGGAVAVLGLVAMIVPAAARDLCPERPGQTTPPCTVEPGHLLLETGLIDWSFQQNTQSRSDTLTIGQSALRIGAADHGEVAIGWTSFASQRVRDKLAGLVDRQSGVGDITFGVKRSFGKADAPMAAIKAYVTTPVGTSPSGAGNWTAGDVVPISIPLSATVQLSLTPEIDAVVNGSGSGHHIAYGSAGGLGFKLSNVLSLGADARALRDDDPNGARPK